MNEQDEYSDDDLNAMCEVSANCIVCEATLDIPGGMAGTGMCGPCCTGESETLNEFGDTW